MSQHDQPKRGDAIVRLDGVTKRFRGAEVFSDLDATINAGSVTAIVGPNGAGKSVLFKLICGFLLPDRGTIWVHPAYLSPDRSFPARFGVVIDRPGYLAGSTGMQNLRDLAAIRHIATEHDLRHAMTTVGLDPDARQKVRNYSLGMKQKLALAQALIENPAVLLLDEPFNALDADSVDRVRGILRDFRATGGSVIFTSHNRDDIDLLADEVLTLNSGRLATTTSA
jgi:ABC-2 type transport system ATP-binding protein